MYWPYRAAAVAVVVVVADFVLAAAVVVDDGVIRGQNVYEDDCLDWE